MPLDKPLATSTLKMIKRGRSAGRERIDASLCKTRQAGRKKGTLPCHNGCACMSTKMMLDVLSFNANVDSKHASKRTHADHVKGPRDKTRPPGRKKDLSYIMPTSELLDVSSFFLCTFCCRFQPCVHLDKPWATQGLVVACQADVCL